jgi:hypothetical protein
MDSRSSTFASSNFPAEPTPALLIRAVMAGSLLRRSATRCRSAFEVKSACRVSTLRPLFLSCAATSESFV